MRYKRKDSLVEGRKAILSIRTKKENDEERKSEKKGKTWRGKRRGEKKERGWNTECGWKEAYWELSVNRSKMLKRHDGGRTRSEPSGKWTMEIVGEAAMARRLYKGPQSKISRSLCFFHERAATEPLSFSDQERYISDRVTPRSNFLVPRRDSVSDNLSR